MSNNQLFKGIFRKGRGGSVEAMSAPGVLDMFKRLTGLSVIPGTVNIVLSQSLDIPLTKYVSLAEVGLRNIDLAEVGINYDGEQGFHYGLILVAGQYPASNIIFNRVDNPKTDAEIISPHHFYRIIEGHTNMRFAWEKKNPTYDVSTKRGFTHPLNQVMVAYNIVWWYQ